MASAHDIGPTPDALRIVLVGKPGSGKSSSGNTILGRREFVVKADDKSLADRCIKAESDVDGRRVAVVDTPGLSATSLSNEGMVTEMCKAFSLLAPGPHAFLLLLKIGRFTPEEKYTVQCIKRAFGKEAEKYILVLFTRGDDLEEEETSIEDFLDQSDPALKELISDCGNRFHVFNNRKKERAQVKELLQKIDHMVKENRGSYYTNEVLQDAEEAIQKDTERILKEKEEEIKRATEEIERKYQQQIEMMKTQGYSLKNIDIVKEKTGEKRSGREKEEMERKAQMQGEHLRQQYDDRQEKDKIMKEKEERVRREREEMERKHQQQIEMMKQQGEGMQKFILELQKDHGRQMEKMMGKFEDQARRQAEEMRAQTQESRRQVQEMMMGQAEAKKQRHSQCPIS